MNINTVYDSIHNYNPKESLNDNTDINSTDNNLKNYNDKSVVNNLVLNFKNIPFSKDNMVLNESTLNDINQCNNLDTDKQLLEFTEITKLSILYLKNYISYLIYTFESDKNNKNYSLALFESAETYLDNSEYFYHLFYKVFEYYSEFILKLKFKKTNLNKITIHLLNLCRFEYIRDSTNYTYDIAGIIVSDIDVSVCKPFLIDDNNNKNNSEDVPRVIVSFKLRDYKYDFVYDTKLVLSIENYLKLIRVYKTAYYSIHKLKLCATYDKEETNKEHINKDENIEADALDDKKLNINEKENKCASKKELQFKYYLISTDKTNINIITNNSNNINDPWELSIEKRSEEVINKSKNLLAKNINNQKNLDLEIINNIINNKNADNNESYINNNKNSQFILNNLITSDIKEISLNNNLINNLGNNKPNLTHILSKIEHKFKDFAQHLNRTTNQSFYSINNIKNVILPKKDFIDIIGVVLSYKIENKYTVIQITSLVDSNTFKIFIYNRKLNIDIVSGSIIFFRRIQLKINKNLDIVLENPYENDIEVLGILSNIELNKLKKFRIDSNIEFTNLLSLINPVIVRNIVKISFVVKRIINIQASKDDKFSIEGYSNLNLMSKILIDDGTYEAILWVYGNKVIEMLKIPEAVLKNANLQIKSAQNIILYDRFSHKHLMSGYNFNDLYINRFIGYCIPFNNAFKKIKDDQDYSNILNNITNNNNNLDNKDTKLKAKANNLIYINGEIVTDIFNISNESYLLARPLLKLVSLETLE